MSARDLQRIEAAAQRTIVEPRPIDKLILPKKHAKAFQATDPPDRRQHPGIRVY